MYARFVVYFTLMCSSVGMSTQQTSSTSTTLSIPNVPVARTFDQDLDHSQTVGVTFKQVYYEYQLYPVGQNSTNLMFLYIGGHEKLSMGSLYTSFIEVLSSEYSARIYALEHRYYGASQPYSNLTTDNLKYLTIEQALEDAVNFIKYINKETQSSTNKWIVFGSGYGGNLAIWLRKARPDLVHGAVASSAPVLAQLNFAGFFTRVGKIISQTDATCKTAIHNGIKQMVADFKTTKGKQTISQDFNMCSSPQNQSDQYALTSYIANLFADAVLYNLPSTDGTSNRVEALCKDLLNQDGSTALSKLGSLVYSLYENDGSSCTNLNYSDLFEDILSTDINQYSSRRQWYYQQCSALGYFPTTSSQSPPFTSSLPITFYVGLCQAAFGDSYTKTTISTAVAATNDKYGGKNIKNMTRVITVYGNNDPWKTLGVTSLTGTGSKAIVVDGMWHIDDLPYPLSKDSTELDDARKQIASTLRNWLVD